MASEIEHIELANSNQKLIDHLIAENSFRDWLTTVAFYKAIHVVEAVFANDLHCHSCSHADREGRLKRTARFRAIFMNYSHLLSESRTFRYLLQPPDRLTIETVKSKLIYKRLYAVEQHSLQFLSTKGKEALVKIQPPSPNPITSVVSQQGHFPPGRGLERTSHCRVNYVVRNLMEDNRTTT